MSRAPFREGIAVRHAVSTFPNQLTAARLLLIVVMWVLTWLRLPFYVAIGILAALITDVLDGVIARRLNQASEFGSKFDSLVDNILLPSSLVWLWFLRGEIFTDHPWLTATAVVLYVAALLLGLLRFNCFANLHLYSSRVASIPMYVFVLHALMAERYSAGLFYIAVGLFILA